MPDRLPSLIVLVGFWVPPAMAGLAVLTAALVLPGSALVCALAFRRRGRMLRDTSP